MWNVSHSPYPAWRLALEESEGYSDRPVEVQANYR
jgi:hypothetical protein